MAGLTRPFLPGITSSTDVRQTDGNAISISFSQRFALRTAGSSLDTATWTAPRDHGAFPGHEPRRASTRRPTSPGRPATSDRRSSRECVRARAERRPPQAAGGRASRLPLRPVSPWRIGELSADKALGCGRRVWRSQQRHHSVRQVATKPLGVDSNQAIGIQDQLLKNQPLWSATEFSLPTRVANVVLATVWTGQPVQIRMEWFCVHHRH